MNLLSYFDSIMSETYDEESNWILCLKCYKRIPRIRIFDYNENIMISMNCDCSVKTRVMLLDEYLEICKEEKRKNLFTQDNYCIQCEKFYPDEIRRVHDNMIFSVNHIIINVFRYIVRRNHYIIIYIVVKNSRNLKLFFLHIGKPKGDFIPLLYTHQFGNFLTYGDVSGFRI